MEILKKESYVRAIENSVGSRLFNSLLVRFGDSQEVKDILNDGELSCAYFVSSLLVMHDALRQTHTTVANLKKALSENPKWSEVPLENVEAGDVVFYKKRTFADGSGNAHVGFVLNKDEAVSTDYQKKAVSKHKLDYTPIESVWRCEF
mgnify:CR=1 FL=1